MSDYLKAGKHFTSPVGIMEALHTIGADFLVRDDQVVMLRDVRALITDDNIRVQYEDLEKHTVPAHRAVWRSDTGQPMWIVGSRYRIVQNDSAMLMAEPLVSKHGCQVVWAGQFYDGLKTALAFRLPKAIGIDGVKGFPQKWLVWMNSFDRQQSLTAYCTLFDPKDKALWPGTELKTIKIRHTASIEQRQLEAGKVFQMTNTYLDGVLNTLEWMKDTEVHRDAIERMANAVYPLPEKPDKENATRALRDAMMRGWAFTYPHGDLVDLYRYALQEMEGRRRKRSASAAFKSDVGGESAKRKLELFHLLIELTEEMSGGALPIPEELETVMVQQ